MIIAHARARACACARARFCFIKKSVESQKQNNQFSVTMWSDMF